MFLFLVASPRLCQTYPTNLLILGAFTIAESYIVSSICSIYEPESVLLAAVATAAATFGITFYAMTTKQDFTKWMTSFYGKICIKCSLCFRIILDFLVLEFVQHFCLQKSFCQQFDGLCRCRHILWLHPCRHSTYPRWQK